MVIFSDSPYFSIILSADIKLSSWRDTVLINTTDNGTVTAPMQNFTWPNTWPQIWMTNDNITVELNITRSGNFCIIHASIINWHFTK